jgi:hypothetical protein
VTTDPEEVDSSLVARPGKAEQAMVDLEALHLRSEGKSYRAIGDAVGCSGATAHARTMRAIAREGSDDVHAVREIELTRLDHMWNIAWAGLHEDHAKVDHGHVVIGETANPYPTMLRSAPT